MKKCGSFTSIGMSKTMNERSRWSILIEFKYYKLSKYTKLPTLGKSFIRTNPLSINSTQLNSEFGTKTITFHTSGCYCTKTFFTIP